MTDIDAASSDAPRFSVFLSYASEDREAARLLRDALPNYGLDVWYDESELGGGEAWDQKIRRQIRECDYFMPVVSAQTERRHEGYFRREWRLGVERTLDMADDHPFLLPIVIDDTDQSAARVPEKFLTVQWLKVPGGRPTKALETLCRRIAAGNSEAAQRVAKAPRAARKAAAARALPNPVFPHQEPGQKLKFLLEVGGWALQWTWLGVRRLPRWIRVVAGIWICITLISHCNSSSHHESREVTPAKVEKLKEMSQNYQGISNKNDIAKLGMDIAKQFVVDSDDEAPTGPSPLLAIAFTAPPGDAAAEKLANSAFAMAYGRLAISHHGQVELAKEALPCRELGPVLERGKANHASYVLCGTVDTVAGARVLTIKIATVADGSVLWSKSYSAAGADPAKIAADVDANIPPLPPT
jgi:hypothetical protein